MPWEGLHTPELSRKVRKEVLALGKEDELLSREPDELEQAFNFDMNVYSYLAVVLVKTDNNLAATYEKLVPDLVDDDHFWCNYFYEIELIKHAHGLPSLIGGQVVVEKRSHKVEEADQELLQSQDTTVEVPEEEASEEEAEQTEVVEEIKEAHTRNEEEMEYGVE